MSDILSKIDHPPSHTSKLPEMLPPQVLSTLTAGDKWLYDSISVIQQDMDWVKHKTIEAYNMAVEHRNERTKSRRWVARTVFAAIVGGCATALFEHYFVK